MLGARWQRIADLRQYAGLDQLLVDFIVDRAEARHHVAVEQFEDDQARVDRQLQLAHGQAKCL